MKDGWTIFEDEGFSVVTWKRPHIDRADGGHIVIVPPGGVPDRRFLAPRQAVRLMWLSIVVAEAMFDVLPKCGIQLEKVNFQENGNWGLDESRSPSLHLHLYGRARNSRYQEFGQALFLPDPSDAMYEKLEPFRLSEIELLSSAVASISHDERFAIMSSWCL
jgi:hypothetical protein